jgi:hypothetical protein
VGGKPDRRSLRYAFGSFLTEVSCWLPVRHVHREVIIGVSRVCSTRTADSDDALVAGFHQIDLSVSKGFEWQGLDDAAKRGLARAIKTGEQIVESKWAAAGETTNGWKYTFAGGRAGFDLGLRARSPSMKSAPNSPIRSSTRTRASTTKANPSKAQISKCSTSTRTSSRQ